jgi:hypothetical protein
LAIIWKRITGRGNYCPGRSAPGADQYQEEQKEKEGLAPMRLFESIVPLIVALPLTTQSLQWDLGRLARNERLQGATRRRMMSIARDHRTFGARSRRAACGPSEELE